MNTKQRVSAPRGQASKHPAVPAVNVSAAIEFRCRGTPQGRKIATNNFGSREMSAKLMLSLSFSSGRWCTHILSHLLGLKVDHWLCYNAFLQLTAPLP